MSDPAPPAQSRGPLVILGTLAAFASFALIAAILQTWAGGRPSDPQSELRLKNKAEIAEAQSTLLKKAGLAYNPDAAIAKAVAQIGMRKLETSKVVVPGSPTAIKQAAPAPAPATRVKPAAAPAPVPPPASRPAAPAGSPPSSAPLTPAPAPVPAAPPPAPPVPGAGSK
jgi:hypothetical protein